MIAMWSIFSGVDFEWKSLAAINITEWDLEIGCKCANKVKQVFCQATFFPRDRQTCSIIRTEDACISNIRTDMSTSQVVAFFIYQHSSCRSSKHRILWCHLVWEFSPILIHWNMLMLLLNHGSHFCENFQWNGNQIIESFTLCLLRNSCNALLPVSVT